MNSNSISLTDSVSTGRGHPQQELRRRVPETILFDSVGKGGGDPDDFPPPPAPVGLLCRPGRPSDPKPAPYSLSAIISYPDPGYPETTDEPEYSDFGREISRHDKQHDAATMCEMYSHLPGQLPPLDFIPTHLVVNDHTGREVYRRPLAMQAA